MQAETDVRVRKLRIEVVKPFLRSIAHLVKHSKRDPDGLLDIQSFIELMDPLTVPSNLQQMTCCVFHPGDFADAPDEALERKPLRCLVVVHDPITHCR